ncbi:aquaporin [Basidiobolus meristosporus CBS 931.73]|uniref:Aquaporin n=1 Tax=Basidiobolus meristosporus CBS 931.73 TaxID=1314790 RepID=A0A1Y1WNE2_9FUNG|nr:aquaporin [Basidiobolus meristosporus CBS 931.73]|eukprot:ORX75061.1 aquaporin [Basidiobolus meristosporus CBS 931.73]
MLNRGAIGAFRSHFREYLAEFLGTMVFISFIIGVVHQVKMGLGGYADTGNTIVWGVGFAFMMGLFMSAGISGGHINPAVTLAMAVNRGFPWRKVPGYMFSQLLGAFFAAVWNYTLFKAQIDVYDGGNRNLQSCGLYVAFLPDYMTIGNAWVAEFFATAFFVGGIFAITDKLNAGAIYFAPVALGLMITGIGFSFGSLSGYSMNPARDAGPRIFTAMAGWHSIGFTGTQHFFWVVWTAPFVGAVVGGFIYEFFACTTPKKSFH